MPQCLGVLLVRGSQVSSDVSISFGPNGSKLTFDSREQLITYLESIEFLGWTRQLSVPSSKAGSLIENAVAELIQECVTAAQAYELDTAKEHIEQSMVEHPFPTGDTPLAIWLLNLAKINVERSAYALLSVIDLPIASFDFRCAVGAADVLLFREGISPLAALSARGKVDQVIAQAEKKFSTFGSKFAEIKSAMLSLMDTIEEEAEKKQKERDKSLRTVALSASQQAADAIQSIKQTEKAYIEYMSLEAPVTYWTEKAKRHRRALKGEGWKIGIEFIVPLYFILLLLVAGSYLFFVVLPLHDPLDTSKSIGLSALGLLFTTTALWYARLLTRQLMRHRALYEDAEERSVLLKSYIALARDGQVQKEDRILALGAAFRSANDGSSDDGAPDISTAAIIGRLVQNK